jgi:hypothetical protein
MNRHTTTLIVASTLLSVMSLSRPATAQPAARIHLVVANQASVPPDTLSAALAEVRRIYTKIGVQVIVTDSAPIGRTSFFISIVPEKMARQLMSNTEVFGTAFVGGILAYVVYERVESFAKRWGNTTAITLGLTIAHELGHLLLRNRSHAAVGLMRPVWNLADGRLASSGWLLFTTLEAAVIRNWLSDGQ